jgi:NADPH-dependent 2,4-dienoyl-CoA reductase/sulfur reductase-like enzyme
MLSLEGGCIRHRKDVDRTLRCPIRGTAGHGHSHQPDTLSVSLCELFRARMEHCLAERRRGRIDLVLGSRVSSLDVRQRSVQLENGKTYGFGALLIATGAELSDHGSRGATDAQIHSLRTFADSRAIVAKATSAKRVVVVGASFIGLEVAASLRARGIDVHVVAPENQPLERVMGKDVGLFIGVIIETRRSSQRIRWASMSTPTKGDCRPRSGGVAVGTARACLDRRICSRETI